MPGAEVTAVAVATLMSGSHRGQVCPLTGSQALTGAQQLDAIGSAVGPYSQFHQASPEQFRRSMQKYLPKGINKMLLDYWSNALSHPDLLRPPLPQVTDKLGLTPAQEANDHIADFT